MSRAAQLILFPTRGDASWAADDPERIVVQRVRPMSDFWARAGTAWVCLRCGGRGSASTGGPSAATVRAARGVRADGSLAPAHAWRHRCPPSWIECAPEDVALEPYPPAPITVHVPPRSRKPPVPLRAEDRGYVEAREYLREHGG